VGDFDRHKVIPLEWFGFTFPQRAVRLSHLRTLDVGQQRHQEVVVLLLLKRLKAATLAIEFVDWLNEH